jgi:hypothetical protein
VIVILSGLRKFTNGKFKWFNLKDKWFHLKDWSDQTFFDDILKIFLFGFIEIGTAAILTLQSPRTSLEHGFVNISLAVIMLLELVVVLPMTYSLILGQKQEVYRRKKF